MQVRRRHARACRLVCTAILLAALLFLLAIPNSSFIASPLGTTPSRPWTPRRLPLDLGGAVRQATQTQRQREADAVLLPDWEVLVLLSPGDANAASRAENATCAFWGGASSPARALGTLPSSGRHAYTCAMPEPARHHRLLHAPRVVSGTDTDGHSPGRTSSGQAQPMLAWSGWLVYDSVTVDGGDVLVFAKGVNRRQGVNLPASDIRCVYYRGSAADDVVASLPATTSAQQVFRCPPPPPPPSSPQVHPAISPGQIPRVTLAVAGEEPIPSLATYNPVKATGGAATAVAGKKSLICACTMVRDVAKFLREWVVYHAAVGVDRFYIYDNGSEDDLADRVRQLSGEGYDISTKPWPWPKTQEAGFSHSAAVHRDSCEWMAFIDVDEFIFSPRWAKSGEPTKSMIRQMVSVKPNVGQVYLGCADFGPSGRTTHPVEGVTQGYTCRRKKIERHKSLVRLDAVDRSLVNSIHHFALQPEARSKWNRRARVNHYKYQAWSEFKVKFRRRVSSYVDDWTKRVNPRSKDRTPGLGFEAVQPDGWAHKFCEIEDTFLRNVTRKWFGNTL